MVGYSILPTRWIKHWPGTQAAGDQTRTQLKFIVFLSSRIPPPCALSLSQCLLSLVPACILVIAEVKREDCGKILAVPSVRQNTDISAMNGRKGVLKKVIPYDFFILLHIRIQHGRNT